MSEETAGSGTQPNTLRDRAGVFGSMRVLMRWRIPHQVYCCFTNAGWGISGGMNNQSIKRLRRPQTPTQDERVTLKACSRRTYRSVHSWVPNA